MADNILQAALIKRIAELESDLKSRLTENEARHIRHDRDVAFKRADILQRKLDEAMKSVVLESEIKRIEEME